MKYKISIKNFEGPFDLLVYLVEKNKMNIYDIDISQITNDYLVLIDEAREKGIQISSEFLVLATTLMEIKSFMLLPIEQTPEGDSENPKTELERKLALYKQIKTFSLFVKEHEHDGKLVRKKSQEDYVDVFGGKDEILLLPIDKFIKSFMLFIEKKKTLIEINERFQARQNEQETMISKMAFIHSLFEKSNGGAINFKETITNKNDPREIVLSFVSILEMLKEKLIRIEQSAPFGDIILERN